MAKKPLIVIAGPTAVGKSKIAVELASVINGEVISADSMQIYKKMNIGTAKLSSEERIGSNGVIVPHHMIDIIEPYENFSVAEYQKMANKKIEEIYERGKQPLLVGGTGLYINSVIDDYEFEKMPQNEQFRRNLYEIAKEKGNQYLYNILEQIDIDAAKKIHVNDLKRIIRAIEYYEVTGKQISKKNIVKAKKSDYYNLAYFGLNCSRNLLYKKINKRVDDMLNRGLLDEIKYLIEIGVPLTSNAMQGLGYKQLAMYLKGTLTYDEAVKRFKRDTRHYAKRQLTWFKKDKRIIWINLDKETSVSNVVEKIKVKIGRILDI